MRIGIPVWQGRVSPVFDTAKTLLVVDREGPVETSRSETPLPDTSQAERVAALGRLGVQTLLCGAVSRPVASLLSASGIVVVPFLNGNVDEVIEAYVTGSITDPRFLMPGCCGRRRRRGRRRGRGGPWWAPV